MLTMKEDSVYFGQQSSTGVILPLNHPYSGLEFEQLPALLVKDDQLLIHQHVHILTDDQQVTDQVRQVVKSHVFRDVVN